MAATRSKEYSPVRRCLKNILQIRALTQPPADAKNVLTAQRAPMLAWWGLSVRSKAVPGLKPNPEANHRKGAVSDQHKDIIIQPKYTKVTYIQTTK
jgi:hypothetical protein